MERVIPLSGFVNNIQLENMNAASKKQIETENLRKAVQSFETLLWEEMLKTTNRATESISNEPKPHGIEYFSSMLYSQFSMELSKQNDGDYSLTESIIKQLS